MHDPQDTPHARRRVPRKIPPEPYLAACSFSDSRGIMSQAGSRRPNRRPQTSAGTKPGPSPDAWRRQGRPSSCEVPGGDGPSARRVKGPPSASMGSRFLRWPRCILGLVVGNIAPGKELRCGARNRRLCLPRDKAKLQFLSNGLTTCTVAKISYIPSTALRFSRIPPAYPPHPSSPFSRLEPSGETWVPPRLN